MFIYQRVCPKNKTPKKGSAVDLEYCPEVEYLHRGNVRRVVVGHKPSGEAPAILRTSGVDGKGCLFFYGFFWCCFRPCKACWFIHISKPII